MSLITRCPACSTMFRVVADQLRVSDGWVRCGHCAEVFDAWAHEATADQLAAMRLNEPVVGAPSEPDRDPAGPGGASAPSSAGLPEGAGLPAPALPGVAAGPATDVAQTVPQAPPAEVAAAAAEPEAVSARRERRRDRTRLRPPAVPAAEVPAAERPPADAVDTPAEPLPAFLQSAPAVRSARSGPGVQIAWGLTCLVLVSALALQVLISQRDRLATWVPETRVVLEPVCQAIGCELGPLKDPLALRVDSSAFNKIRGDLYRLSFSVSNAAGVTVAAPAMELSLTDLDDRVVARRVLKPSDLPQSPVVLAPGQVWSGQWTVSVVASELGGRVAGYRLLAFYP